jgi:hypothetical protein
VVSFFRPGYEAFARHVELYTGFANVSGIVPGAEVQVARMDAGQLLAMEVPQSPAAKFRIKVRINEKLSGLVRAGLWLLSGQKA